MYKLPLKYPTITHTIFIDTNIMQYLIIKFKLFSEINISIKFPVIIGNNKEERLEKTQNAT